MQALERLRRAAEHRLATAWRGRGFRVLREKGFGGQAAVPVVLPPYVPGFVARDGDERGGRAGGTSRRLLLPERTRRAPSAAQAEGPLINAPGLRPAQGCLQTRAERQGPRASRA